MLKNLSDDKIRFTCDLYKGKCCYGESVELEYDKDFDDVEGGPYASLELVAYPRTLWDTIIYWFKHRYVFYVAFYMHKESLVALRSRIDRILEDMKP